MYFNLKAAIEGINSPFFTLSYYYANVTLINNHFKFEWEIEISGPFEVDLLTGSSSPEIILADIEPGTVLRI